MDLTIKYDPKADILAVKLRESAVKDEELLDSDVVLGFDEDGEIVALEVWDASKRGLLKILAELVDEKREIVENLLKRARARATTGKLAKGLPLMLKNATYLPTCGLSPEQLNSIHPNKGHKQTHNNRKLHTKKQHNPDHIPHHIRSGRRIKTLLPTLTIARKLSSLSTGIDTHSLKRHNKSI